MYPELCDLQPIQMLHFAARTNTSMFLSLAAFFSCNNNKKEYDRQITLNSLCGHFVVSLRRRLNSALLFQLG